MGYWKDNGEYADTDEAHLASGVLAASLVGEPIPAGDRGTMRLTLDVTAVSGTSPTVAVTLETSEDKLSWRTLGTFVTATAVGKERKVFAGCDRYVRANEVLGGSATPTVTRTISGEFC